jgi:hypothetical protein
LRNFRAFIGTRFISYNGVILLTRQAIALKCPKCGLDPDERHTPEYYSNCRRCSAIVQRRKLLPEEDWRRIEGSAAPKNDCFCRDCGRLLVAPALFCLACEMKKKAPPS